MSVELIRDGDEKMKPYPKPNPQPQNLVSPCVSVCDFSPGYCTGCGRTREEKTAFKEAPKGSIEQLILYAETLGKSQSRLGAELWENWMVKYTVKLNRLLENKSDIE